MPLSVGFSCMQGDFPASCQEEGADVAEWQSSRQHLLFSSPSAQHSPCDSVPRGSLSDLSLVGSGTPLAACGQWVGGLTLSRIHIHCPLLLLPVGVHRNRDPMVPTSPGSAPCCWVSQARGQPSAASALLGIWHSPCSLVPGVY